LLSQQIACARSLALDLAPVHAATAAAAGASSEQAGAVGDQHSEEVWRMVQVGDSVMRRVGEACWDFFYHLDLEGLFLGSARSWMCTVSLSTVL
jgi:hypothetical protein